MHIPFTWEEIGYGFGIPAVVALALLWNLRWMLPSAVGRRYAPSVAFSAGMIVGYWLLNLGPLQPEPDWQWLPHFMLMATVVGMISASEDLNVLDRFLLFALATGAAALILIPTWEDLSPPRQQYLIGLTSLVVLLALGYRHLLSRIDGPVLPFVFFMTCLSGAVLLMHSGSLVFGAIGLTAAGATLGLTIASRVDKNSRSLDGLAYPLVFFLCNSLMIGHTNSFGNIPIYSYALIPCAPLGLLFSTKGPLSGGKGIKGIMLQIFVPLLICAAALGTAFWFEPLAGTEAY